MGSVSHGCGIFHSSSLTKQESTCSTSHVKVASPLRCLGFANSEKQVFASADQSLNILLQALIGHETKIFRGSSYHDTSIWLQSMLLSRPPASFLLMAMGLVPSGQTISCQHTIGLGRIKHSGEHDCLLPQAEPTFSGAADSCLSSRERGSLRPSFGVRGKVCH